MDGIALHRARVDLGGGASLDIESSLGRGVPINIDWSAPGLTAAEIELDASNLLSGSIPPMRWLESGALFEPFQLREDTDYFVDVTVPIRLSDAQERSKENAAWPFYQRIASAFKRDPSRRWREIEIAGRMATVVTGQLRLRSHAGILNFATEFGYGFYAEVVCRKLGYFKEFKSLLDSLADKAAELLLSYDSPVSLSFGISEKDSTNDAALHFQMRRLMSPSQLPSVIEEILANPHSQLIDRISTVSIEEIEDTEAGLVIDGLDMSSLGSGGPLARFFGGFTPKELPQRELIESHNTAENRYTKAFLEHCRLISSRLEVRMGIRKRRAAEREAKAWRQYLDEVLRARLWRDIGPLTQIPGNSQTLLRKRGYKELFRLDFSLRMALALEWHEGAQVADGLIGDIRPVSQIYEFWCFFMLREILLSFCEEVHGGNFVQVSKDGLQVNLARGMQSECLFTFSANNGTCVRVSLFHNQKFKRPTSLTSDWNGSYTAAFDPDFSIAVIAESSGTSMHWIHFDAKYRLDRRKVGDLFVADIEVESGKQEDISSSYEAELTRIHKQDDLFKMHTYRDGILSTRGAYILFPGDGVGGKFDDSSQNIFVRHPSAFAAIPTHKVPSVGAFDLTPNGNPEQLIAIRDLLLSVFEEAALGTVYTEERAFFT